MRTLKFLFSIVAVMVLNHAGSALAANLPNIKILATGGTIAGLSQSATQAQYQAAKVGVDLLIEAVPEMTKIANISGEQVAQIGSYNMNDEVWLKIAKRVNELLKQGDVDGIVITHGTDSMEETAYFLNLVVKSNKPVVLVGAMRPSNAMSADGPFNLYNAVVVAGSKSSAGRGVLLAMNDVVLDARDVTKTITTQVQTFVSPNFGPLGYVYNGKVHYQRSPQRAHTTKSEFDVTKLDKLPRVGIVYNNANAALEPAQALIDAKYDGIVSAGMGNGSIYGKLYDVLKVAAQQGIVVVRSSRVYSGATTLEAGIDYADHGLVAAGMLNPQKARILLQLALTKTKDPKKIQEMFEKY